MPKTRLISPGSIPNHRLLKNLQLNDNYISNDGGDEGISIADAGDVGVGMLSGVAPTSKLEVFNSNVQLDGGTTGYQIGTTFVDEALNLTAAMIGSRVIFDDGTDAGTVTAYLSAAAITVSTNQTVGGDGDERAFKIYYPSARILTESTSTSLKIGAGAITGDDADLTLSTGLTTQSIAIKPGGLDIYEFGYGSVKFKSSIDSNDYLEFVVGSGGISTIKTYADPDNNAAQLTIAADGELILQGSGYQGIQLEPATKSASGVHDATLTIRETLNHDSAGGSDVHHGIRYTQTQTDLSGWDSVYLMYLYGGDAARTFAIKGDGKVGIGVEDPASPLEIFSTSSQLKISYDASNYADIGVTSTGELEIATTGSSNQHIRLDAAGQIVLESVGTVTIDNNVSLLSGKVIYFDSTDTKIGSNSDDPEDMIIEADQDILMSPDNNLDIAAGGEIDFNASTCGFTAQTGTDAVSIDWTAGNKYHLLMENNSTVTFATNPTNPCNLLLKVAQGNGGSKIITWAVTSGDIYWAGGGKTDTDKPTLTTTDDDSDILSFYFDGTNYFGVASLNFDTAS